MRVVGENVPSHIPWVTSWARVHVLVLGLAPDTLEGFLSRTIGIDHPPQTQRRVA